MSNMTLINENMRKFIADRISNGICERIFIGDAGIRSQKIEENINLSTLNLLGKKINKDKVETFIQMFVDRYVGAIVRKGEAVGVIAAQSLVQPITQAVLKSQHGTGRKQEGSGSTSLIHLNRLKVSTRVVNIHLKDLKSHQTRVRKENNGISLLTHMRHLYEEVKFSDILTSNFGDAKYSPDEADEDYSTNPAYVFFNHNKSIKKGQPIYKFVMTRFSLSLLKKQME
jgi:RNA polymerase Rpb1, domain 5